jgi:hypothetical protein
MAERSIRRLEHGERRTRISTLRLLAHVLVDHSPVLPAVEEVAAQLIQAAGPSLADESPYGDRIEARRHRRRIRRAGAGVVEHSIEMEPLMDGSLLERHRHRRWITNRSYRERRYVRIVVDPGDRPTFRVPQGSDLCCAVQQKRSCDLRRVTFASPAKWRTS